MKNEQKNQIVRDLLHLGAYLQKNGNRVTQGFGLTQQQFVVLNEIVEKGPLNQKQIVGRLLLEKSNVSKIIKKLHAKDLVHISMSEIDARSTQLTATSKGKMLKRQCIHQLNQWSLTWLEPLAEKETEDSINILTKLKNLISQADESII